MNNRMDKSDEEIVRKAIEGDSESFEKLYRKYYNLVYFTSAQYFKNKDMAKDIVQEVFIKVYRQIGTLNQPKAFISWLQVITHRECHNYNRKKLKVYELREDENIDEFADSKKLDVIEKIENDRIKDEIMNVLENMSQPLRTVAVMRFFEELKLQEIADILGIPKNTVSSRLMRIKKKLSAELKKKDVYKNYGVVILSPALLHEIYVSLSNKYILSEEASSKILQVVLAGSGTTIGGISLFSKIIIGGLTSAVLIGGGYTIFNQNGSDKSGNFKVEFTMPSIAVEPLEVNASIVNVHYDTNWTNDSVYLEIETSNNNFDKILVNDVETLKINTNGNYSIKLVKDNEVIDETSINVSNIDKDSPLATGKKKDNYYVLHLSDDSSGVDIQTIEYYKNGVVDYNYTYNQQDSAIVFENDITALHEFYVTDNAGNTLGITVKLI